MYTVWNTLHPDQVKEVIAFANQQRYGVTHDKQKEDSIQISEEWKQQLDQMPFVSKQKGKMSALLK